MRFLDLDLDFFLNGNAYRSEPESGRQSFPYKPWAASAVRHFLEHRCGLSRAKPVPGRAVESHDGVFDFWRNLIKSGDLESPFEVVHIDAHPDLVVGRGMHLISSMLYIDSGQLLAVIRQKQIHQGNYLSFAIALGWIASLTWIPLGKILKGRAIWDGDARQRAVLPPDSKCRILSSKKNPVIPFRVLPWRRFKATEKFDYIALSRSPEFTPPESDELIPVIEEYIKKI